MKQREGFFGQIGRDNCYIAWTLFFVFFAQGAAHIMLGSILPMLKAEYALNYQVGGMLLSLQSVGFAIAGLGAGFLPLYIGMKRSFLLLASGCCIGMGMLLVSGNPLWLLLAMFLFGIGRGGVSTYNNQIITELADGSAGPLNLLHAFFAIGACLAPLIVLLCGRADSSGWHLAVLFSAILLLLGLLASLRMKAENMAHTEEIAHRVSYGFLKEKIFWLSTLICFFYQGIEGTVIGWLTSFFVDSHVMTMDFAQVVTSTLWIALLVGRLGCAKLASRFRPAQMLLGMAIGQLAFLALLVTGSSFGVMIAATVGLGLSMSGMYGTSVSNAGDLIARYPVCMGFFVLITSIGAVIAPWIVGIIADAANMRAGLSCLLLVAAALMVTAGINLRLTRKAVRTDTAENRICADTSVEGAE